MSIENGDFDLFGNVFVRSKDFRAFCAVEWGAQCQQRCKMDDNI